MRFLLTLLVSLFAFASQSSAYAQTCTGLCLQQTTCSGGGTTTISGVVYAPNGVDPLPNVLVFVPNAPVDAFVPGVSCPAPGAPPSGQPLVGSTTAVDGSFTILNAPVGTSIPLVIQTGRWRRQFVISTVTACTDNPQTNIRFPKNQSEGDIPKFAISTGALDQVECVLRKVGIDDAEFTNPGGTGRINLYQASNAAGSRIDTSTPKATALMGDLTNLESYDVLMLPCEGNAYVEPAAQLANLVTFANAGGRVYASHYAYEWLSTNPPFNTVVNWSTNQNVAPDPGVATIDTSFSDGQTLAQWLQIVGATTTQGQMPISTLRKNFNGVNAPTQSYMTLNNATYGNPVMQFVFDAPVGNTTNQCGRVLFDEYHVENPPTTPTNLAFPTECSTAAITPQEKLLEYSLFELTSDGSAATLTPATQDFGSEPIGFSSNPQTFTWTNNSTFPSGVTLLTTTGDFSVTGNNCSAVASGKSCQITVVFKPTVLGARTGVLTVGSPGSTLTSTLTGTGTPALTVSTSSQDFGSVDVGAHVSRSTISVVNQATGALPLPSITLSGTGGGDYSVSNSCGGVVPALQTCALTVVFTPSTTGPRPAVLTVNAAGAPQTAMLTGNGVDFTVGVAPANGSVIAGYSRSFTMTTTPLAGFGAPLSLSCSTNVPASTCSLTTSSVTSTAATNLTVTVTTTSKYTVVGYGGGYGRGTGLLWLVGVGSAGMLWFGRRRMRGALRTGLAAVVVIALGVAVSGCSSVLPAQNASYTPAGDYSVTVQATDGFLTHSGGFALHVTTN